MADDAPADAPPPAEEAAPAEAAEGEKEAEPAAPAGDAPAAEAEGGDAPAAAEEEAPAASDEAKGDEKAEEAEEAAAPAAEEAKADGGDAAGGAGGDADEAKSAPAEADDIKKGYFLKQGGGTSLLGRKSWKKRYFVLAEGKLSYYADEAAYNSGAGPLKDRKINLSDFRVEVAPKELSLIPDDNNLKPIAADEADSDEDADSDGERSAATLKSRRWEFKFEEEEGDDSPYSWRDAINEHKAKYKPAVVSSAPGAAAPDSDEE